MTQDIEEQKSSLTQARILADAYMRIQKSREQIANSIFGMQRDFGISPEDTEEIHGITDVQLKNIEDEIFKQMKNLVKPLPIFNEWLIYVVGIGPTYTTKLLALIGDIERFPKISMLWKYCYNEQTEVLTKDGWKLFRDVTYEDEIMSLNTDKSLIEYQKPIDIQKFVHKGKMVKWESKAYDMLVTPEHKMYIKKSNWDEFKLVKAENLIKLKTKGYYEFKRNGKYLKGEDREFMTFEEKGQNNSIGKLPIHDWLEFFGWYLAEGSVDKHGNQNLPRIQLSQKEGVDKERIIELIKDFGFSPYIGKDGFKIEFHSIQLYNYLKQFGDSYNKFIPKWIKELPVNRIKILLESMMKGDGGDNLKRYNTVSKQLADDYQELAIKCGYASTIAIHKQKHTDKPLYRVTLINDHKTPTVWKLPKEVDYDGFVYDVTVPKYHVIMVRRNGKQMWSGNSGLAPVKYCKNCGMRRFFDTEEEKQYFIKKNYEKQAKIIDERSKRGKAEKEERKKDYFKKISNSVCNCDNPDVVVAEEKPRKNVATIEHNRKLKTLMYLIGEQFVLQGRYYRGKYDDFKAYETAKNKDILTKGHIHARARRKVSKLFLSHLWQQWRELEGLSVTEPYSKAYLGHAIDPVPKPDFDNKI